MDNWEAGWRRTCLVWFWFGKRASNPVFVSVAEAGWDEAGRLDLARNCVRTCRDELEGLRLSLFAIGHCHCAAGVFSVILFYLVLAGRGVGLCGCGGVRGRSAVGQS